MRQALAVAQVGLALVLLVCAGLVGRSFLNLLRIDVGFDPARVLTMDVQLPDASRARHDDFYAALLERVRAMPGVESAGAIYQRPLEFSGIGMDGSVLIEGQRTAVEFRDWEKNPRVNLESVDAGVFRGDRHAPRARTRLRGRAIPPRPLASPLWARRWRAVCGPVRIRSASGSTRRGRCPVPKSSRGGRRSSAWCVTAATED